MSLSSISRDLSSAVSAITIGDAAAYTYNPLDYARKSHEVYLRKYGKGKKEALWLGMNPGPFGMAQTGVPFGDIAMVRDWMGITAPVGKPATEHPKRPIDGFDCPRSEVSGTRLWSLAKHHYPDASGFFERFFVINFCPLVFMEEGGKNITPDKLPAQLRDPLFEACDEAVRSTVKLLKPDFVLGVGAFAKKQAERALVNIDVEVGTILHPSPASPAANRGWAEAATKQLKALGIELP